MNVYKYTNEIDMHNVLEAIIMAENITDAKTIAKKINKKQNWGNADNDKFKKIPLKKGVLLTSVFWD